MKLGKRAKAKKYKVLRAKQAKANKLLSEARTRLGSDHNEIKKISAKKKTFFNKRGLKAPSRFSFKSLSAKDVKMYEELLDSIINDFETNTYLNEEKYNDLRERLEANFNERWGNTGIDADTLIDMLESDIVAQLKALGIAYAEVFDRFRDYPNASTEDVMDALNAFLKGYKDNDVVADDFLLFADDYMTLRGSEITNGMDENDFNYMLDIYRSLPEDNRDVNTLQKIIDDFNEDEEAYDFEYYVKEYIEKWL